MANKKVTYTFELDAEISNLENKLKGAKSALNDVLKSSGAPAGLKKSLESLEDMLGRLRDKASTPLETVGDVGKVKKDITTVMQALNGLNRVIEDLHNISGDERFKLLPPDIVQKLTAAISGIKTFEDSLKAATTETAALAKAREDLANATTGLAQKEADLQAKQSKLKENTERRDQIKQEIEAIEERKKALEEAKKEQAKVDAFYSTPNADGTKKDRRQKYDGVASTPAQAKKKTDNLAKQVATDKGTLQNLSDELKIVNKDIESYSGQVATARRRADEAKTSFEGLNAKVESLNQAFQTDSAKKQQEAYDELRKTAAEAGLEMNDFSESFSPEEANKIIAALKKLKNDAMDGVTDSAKAATIAMDGFSDEAEELRHKTDAATDSINEQNEALHESEAFEAKIKQFLGLSGAAQVMRAALRDAIHTITELDATMTEMAVVTDLTVGDYWDQLPKYSKQASDLGVSINSAYEAATLYYQQGLKGNEVTKISAETLKLAKIAGIDAADATNKMTAALRGFNMELNEMSAQRVSDVYSELAAITAADVDEISNAMTKTASIAHSAGMEFETTAAFLSQIIETTRESAETAGTAMKTVIARFQELKKDPAEIGEVDGEIVDANKIETALRSVGVALRDSSGQFRDLDDVFLELSSKWDGLDKNTQRYIATIAAGSRQQSRFIAMMSDYSRTQELVNAANTSAGASNKQFEKTMDSLEAKLEKLKNAWHEFTMGIMESDLVKFGVDVLTKFLEVVNKATSALNGIGGSLTKIISVVGIFKLGSKIFEKIKQPLIDFFADVVKMSREEGEKAGKAFDEGTRKGAQTEQSKVIKENDLGTLQKLEPSRQTGSTLVKTGAWIGEKTGFFDINKGLGAKKRAQGIIDNKNNAIDNFKKVASQHSEDTQEFLDAEKKLNDATKEYKELMGDAKTEQEALLNAGYKGSQQVAAGLQKAGSMMIGFGMACSMAGGALAAAGFEEAGETLATIGNWAMIAGSAISALGPIVTTVGNIAKAQGISTMAAWGWVLGIVAGIALLVGGIIAIAAYINNISPEKKLEKAQANANAAKEAVEQADEAFQELNNSLSSLDEQYDTLENLREGTEEWNKAVQDVNASVLELIDKYPELAGLVENDDGVLKLDIESDEVQDVIKKYESSAAQAKAVQYGAEAKVTQAQQDVDFSNLSAVNKVSQRRGWEAFGKSTAIGTGVGTGAGMGLGLVTGPFAAILSPVLGGVGAVGGALVGAITGAIIGPIENAKTHTDKELQKAVEALALSVQEGATDMDFADMRDFLKRQDVADDEAEIMANEFSKNTDSLIEFGKATQASKAALDAQYSAMAMQAKQMINLGAYTVEEQDQMSNIIDGQAMKEIEEKRAQELEKEYQNKPNTEEFNDMKDEYAKEMYGAGARVDGNKILDEAGNEVREFEDEDAFAAAMASAQATKEAAKAMEAVPNAINKSAAYFEKKVKGSGEAFEKLFNSKDGKALTQGEINSLTMSKEDLQAFWNLSPSEGGLTAEEKEVYGNDFEKYWSKYNDTLQVAKMTFDAANKKLRIFNKNIELSANLSAESAKAWVNTLDTLNTGGASAEELKEFDTSFDSIIKGLSTEEVDKIMSEINSIDKTDKNAWDNLLYRFKELGLMAKMDEASLHSFIETGKQVSHAIDKINFSTLADDINNTYKLLNKIKEGGRSYSEEDYKELIAGNKSLENSFTQLGDDFIYVGGSMEDLIDAIKKNTVSKLQEANRQLDARGKMADEIEEYNEGKNTNADLMSEYDMMNYLTDIRAKFNKNGLNISDFGIEGLTNQTDFSKAGAEQLRKWVSQIVIEGGLADVYKTDYAKRLRKANVVRYTQNDALYNAEKANKTFFNEKGEEVYDEYATQHQEALILQAIQSGGVSNELIEAYKEALDNKDFDTAAKLGADIAEATEKIVKASEGRDAYQDLVDRVIDAIEQARQKEIDKLSEVNDSINTANQNLINKIQEQINLDRQKQANVEAQQDISDMYAQQAYLGMDTSGANSLDMLNMDQQIVDAEKDMEQTLVDQAIQNLSDANEEAAQQRERQIDLLQQQLDWQMENGDIAREAKSVVEKGLNQINAGVIVTETDMGKYLFGSEAKGLDTLAGENWASDLQKMATMASNWYALQGIATENTSGDADEDGDGGNSGNSGNAIDANTQRQNNAIAAGRQALTTTRENNNKFDDAYTDYQSAGGTKTKAEFLQAINEGREEPLSEDSNLIKKIGYTNTIGNNWNWGDAFSGEEEEGGVTMGDGKEYRLQVNDGNVTSVRDKVKSAIGLHEMGNGTLFKYNGEYYIWKTDGDGYALKVQSGKLDYNKLASYNTGGIADFTGPAWLDGTKSKPEYVLNADQTERFFALVDVLEGFNDKTTDKKSGDNYFSIQIDVEKLENDYDVEQMANKIRRMITEDATYRNVNSINLIR